ncbi:MAG: serine--tRNA ligase [Flavobacteriales bacterium]|nr:serine--tRNA ligase [Flavobacteriales bacterium]
MLHVARIREEKDAVLAGLAKRNFATPEILDTIISKDDERRSTQAELDTTLAAMNRISKEIGGLFKEGKRDEAEAKKAETAELKERSKTLQEQMAQIDKDLFDLLSQVPNVPNELVPAGNSDVDNEVVKENANKPDLGENTLPHWELAAKHDLIDFELGVKITGAGFPVYKGAGAKLQRALIQFFLDRNTEAGYTEVQPPLVVNADSGFGTGQLPDKEGQMYHVTGDDLYLIPTAEVPVTNIYREAILAADQLPQKLTAYSTCFRREAGSYGKDVRGLNRLHQFDKVEIVQVQHPDLSYAALDEMVSHVESLLQALELPYRILRLCGGDLGFTSALTYDFEVWSAAQERWLEVSSVSNFETFQARRLKLRYRDENGKPQIAHTLNGSALALPRILASLLENNQTADGIKIPTALVPYFGSDTI